MSIDLSLMQSYVQMMQVGQMNGQAALTLIQSATQSQQTAPSPQTQLKTEPQPVTPSDRIIDIRV